MCFLTSGREIKTFYNVETYPSKSNISKEKYCSSHCIFFYLQYTVCNNISVRGTQVTLADAANYPTVFCLASRELGKLQSLLLGATYWPVESSHYCSFLIEMWRSI
jgi:hypothetical protein